MERLLEPLEEQAPVREPGQLVRERRSHMEVELVLAFDAGEQCHLVLEVAEARHDAVDAVGPDVIRERHLDGVAHRREVEAEPDPGEPFRDRPFDRIEREDDVVGVDQMVAGCPMGGPCRRPRP